MSFAESFWTDDYRLGHQTLFDELYEGVKENEDFISLFTKRMELEYLYGLLLEAIPTLTKLLSKRYKDVDYVSTIKNAFGEINLNFGRQGAAHLEIARNIRELVLQPFSKWCKEHEQRVAFLELEIMEKHKLYVDGKARLEKLLKKYFNKCRLIEEFKERYLESDLNEELQDADESLDTLASDSNTELGSEPDSDEITHTFGGVPLTQRKTKALLANLLSSVPIASHKVPILGTYHNVSTGSSISQWLVENMPELKGNFAKAETVGQDLIAYGFIRLVGSMSANKNFINSSQFQYQWKPAVFEFTKISEFDLSKLSQNANYDPIAALGSRTNQLSNYFEDVKQAIGVSTVDFTDKKQFPKLVKESRELDLQYFETAKSLDKLRCEFEETVMDHLSFMQKCEFDRLKAIKKVTFDFMAAFSNKVSSLKHSCEELQLVEETIHPVGDLKFLIENYATGKFQPHVTLYDNYYDSNLKQTFGVDLNVKGRLDKKAVPTLIQAVLSHLDSTYPELEDDEERMNLWIKPVHLSKIHELRFQLNELSDIHEISNVLKKWEPKMVANVLKLYFMELPDSVIPNTYFDLIQTLYQSYPVESHDDEADKSRITGLQNTLTELPVCNLATLDSILTHLKRLINIIGSKNEQLGQTLQTRLSKEFGALILRPKRGASELHGKNINSFNLTMESLQQNFIKDLFTHKEVIFGELRKRNSRKPLRHGSAKVREDDKTAPAQRSKTRLESKLKNAVRSVSEKDGIASTQEAAETLAPSTPPPTPPTKSRSSSPIKGENPLRRSVSPKKKRLSAYLERRESRKDESSDGKQRSEIPQQSGPDEVILVD